MGQGFCSTCGGTYTNATRSGCAECAPYKQSIGAVPPPKPVPGQPTAAVLKLAFWEAMKRCDAPYVGTVENGDEGWIDGHLPPALWEHMADALTELRAAAGLGG